MTDIPIIRIELEHMKLAILKAFADHQVALDADVRVAVEQFCLPGHLRMIINKAVDDTLRTAIEREVTNFYHYGAGRKIIADAVLAKLEEKL